jgi:anti-anti-sigma factor
VLQIKVAPSGATAIVRVSGRVEPGDSVSVYALLKEVLVGEYTGAIVDLNRCRNLDSTFIGMLVVLCDKCSRNDGEFCLANVGEQNRKALGLLGVSAMIPMKHLALDDTPEFVEIDLSAFSQGSKEKIRIMELAHRALVAADKENAERFGSFLRLLEAERSD